MCNGQNQMGGWHISGSSPCNSSINGMDKLRIIPPSLGNKQRFQVEGVEYVARPTWWYLVDYFQKKITFLTQLYGL
jgi:hypothetical protein